MNNVLTYEALKAERDALALENAALKEIIHPIANQNTDVECTDRPVWYVCDPRQMMSPTASSLCHMFHGPFWSRERAEAFLENTSYRYGKKASVFCKSLYHYPEMRKLFDASKNLATPATSAALAAIEARFCGLLDHYGKGEPEQFNPEFADLYAKIVNRIFSSVMDNPSVTDLESLTDYLESSTENARAYADISIKFHAELREAK